MVKRTLHYLWGKKTLLILGVLVIFLLPNIISRDIQVRTVPVITEMTISRTGTDEINITAKKLKATPGEQNIQFDSTTYTGTDIREMLKDVSLAHCTKIAFTTKPDVELLRALYNYRDLRANTRVNDHYTIDQILKNPSCCYQ